MSRSTFAIFSGLALSCAIALSGEPPRAVPAIATRPATQASVAHDFDALARRIAGEYQQSYRRIDDNYRVAPALCAAFAPPSELRLSRSKDQDSHGRKLYRLYTNRPREYQNLDRENSDAQPPTQNLTIVKQSWEAAIAKNPHDILSSTSASRDGITYVPGEQRELFIMTRLDPVTPATDDGWVYATVSADGKTVGASGRLASCMSCHTDAPHGRLFGLSAPGGRTPTTAPAKN